MSIISLLKKLNTESPLSYRFKITIAYHDALRSYIPFLNRWRINASRRHMEKGIAQLKDKQCLDVAFIVSVPGMWKHDYVFKRMQGNERYHPYVVIIPYETFKGYSRNEMEATLQRTEKYFKDKGYEYRIPYDKTGDKWIDIKKAYKPDIVFFTDPYKEMIPMYHAHYFTDTLTCYIPYAFTSMKLYKNNYNKLAINTCGCYFVETEMHKRFAKKYSPAKGQNVYVTGYAGCEIYMLKDYVPTNVWKRQEKQKKRVIWAPHHTIDGTFSVSTFLDVCDDMLDIAEQYSESVQFAFKPHPLLKFKLVEIWGECRTDEYYKKWAEMPNGQLEEVDYKDLFMGSDAMIHDSGGFTTEYLYQRKPVMYLLKNEPEDVFNDFGILSFKQHYTGRTKDDIIRFIENVIIGGDDPMKTERDAFYMRYLGPYNGLLPSENIMNTIEAIIDKSQLH